MKGLLKKFGMTREEFANQMKLSISLVNAWCEKTAKPPVRELRRIAKAFGLELSEVLEYCNG